MSSSAASAQSLETQARLALNSFHEVDASFSDSLRLAQSGGFKTKLLGGVLGTVGDVLGNDTDDSDSSSADDQSGTSENASNTNTNTSTNTSDITSSASHASVDADVDVNANVSANAGSAASADASVDAATSVNAGSTNQGTQDANDVEAGSSLNLGGVLNSQGLLSLMNSHSSRFRSQLQASGHVDLNADGSFDVNETNVMTDVENALRADAEITALNESDVNLAAQAMTKVSADALQRLQDKNLEVHASSQASVNANADAQSALNSDATFTTRFSGEGIDRVVKLSAKGNLGADLVLDEKGNGFTRHASRSQQRQADGSIKVMTHLQIHLASGERMDLVETRFLNDAGLGLGYGSLRLMGNNGSSSQTGDLHSMQMADGSLTSRLDLGSLDLMLHESAQGQVSLANLNQLNANQSNNQSNNQAGQQTDLSDS